MKILEELPNVTTERTDNTEERSVHQPINSMKVALVDGMAEVQSMQKPDWVTQMSHLARHFTNTLFQKYNALKYDEVHLIFNRYDVAQSLKTATRKKQTRRQACCGI